MKKIPFDIKYKEQIESGDYTVVTRDGKPVRIVCWDADVAKPIIATVPLELPLLGHTNVRVDTFTAEGKWMLDGREYGNDLFIVTNDPEFTDFEKFVKAVLECYGTHAGHPCELTDDTVRKMANEFLENARKEIANKELKEGTPSTERLYKEGYEDGKTDTLKNLPKWEKTSGGFGSERFRVWRNALTDEEYFLYDQVAQRQININELLRKLPKED